MSLAQIGSKPAQDQFVCRSGSQVLYQSQPECCRTAPDTRAHTVSTIRHYSMSTILLPLPTTTTTTTYYYYYYCCYYYYYYYYHHSSSPNRAHGVGLRPRGGRWLTGRVGSARRPTDCYCYCYYFSCCDYY